METRQGSRTTRPDYGNQVGWGSGDVAENTEWARDISVEYGQRMFCQLDRDQRRTNDGSRLLWAVYPIPQR